MKKLLITSDCFLPRWDGIARFLNEIIPTLSKSFKITVVAPNFGKIKKVKGVKYVRFPLVKVQFGDIYFSSFNYSKIKEIVKKNDIVFNQTIGTIGISAIRAAKKHKKPCVQYIHSLDWELASKGVSRLRSFVYHAVKIVARRLHNKCSLIIVPSRAVADQISQNKVKTKKMLVPLGINTKYFSPSKDKAKSKKKLKLP